MTDCAKCEHKFKAKPEPTAGQEWAGSIGDGCPVMDTPCPDGDCEKCRDQVAKVFDLGRASLETAMTADEWSASVDCIPLGLEEAVPHYVSHNSGKVIP